MYTATIESKQINKGVIQVGVIYGNGSDNFTEVYSIRGLSDLENNIINKLSQLNSIDLSKIQLGTFIPPVQPVPVPPTQDEIDKI